MAEALAGCSVVVTRERPGELGRLLEERGATVVHVPLIAVIEPVDGGSALRRELEHVDHYDWLMVTSAAGAERVGAAVAGSAVRLGAVGTATADVLAEASGRRVDLIPVVQLARSLADTFLAENSSSQRVLIAQADRASDVLAEALTAAGHDVTVVVAYRTIDVRPDSATMPDVDAVAFASGSAVQSWVTAFGPATPSISVAIGPSTASVASRLGLKLTSVAADHSLDGLVMELERQLARSPAAGRSGGSRGSDDG